MKFLGKYFIFLSHPMYRRWLCIYFGQSLSLFKGNWNQAFYEQILDFYLLKNILYTILNLQVWDLKCLMYNTIYIYNILLFIYLNYVIDIYICCLSFSGRHLMIRPQYFRKEYVLAIHISDNISKNLCNLQCHSTPSNLAPCSHFWPTKFFTNWNPQFNGNNYISANIQSSTLLNDSEVWNVWAYWVGGRHLRKG